MSNINKNKLTSFMDLYELSLDNQVPIPVPDRGYSLRERRLYITNSGDFLCIPIIVFLFADESIESEGELFVNFKKELKVGYQINRIPEEEWPDAEDALEDADGENILEIDMTGNVGNLITLGFKIDDGKANLPRAFELTYQHNSFISGAQPAPLESIGENITSKTVHRHRLDDQSSVKTWVKCHDGAVRAAIVGNENNELPLHLGFTPPIRAVSKKQFEVDSKVATLFVMGVGVEGERSEYEVWGRVMVP